MTAIFKREFRSFFHGMLGYVLTAFLVASSGLYFLSRCLIYGLTDFSYYTLYPLPIHTTTASRVSASLTSAMVISRRKPPVSS